MVLKSDLVHWGRAPCPTARGSRHREPEPVSVRRTWPRGASDRWQADRCLSNHLWCKSFNWASSSSELLLNFSYLCLDKCPRTCKHSEHSCKTQSKTTGIHSKATTRSHTISGPNLQVPWWCITLSQTWISFYVKYLMLCTNAGMLLVRQTIHLA